MILILSFVKLDDQGLVSVLFLVRVIRADPWFRGPVEKTETTNAHEISRIPEGLKIYEYALAGI